MGSSFGRQFRITTFGESHGGGVGVVIDGCPPRLPLDVEEIQEDLDRRRPGQSALTTPRQEPDQAEILSGVFEGLTIGSPIGVLVRNKDARPGAYEHMKDLYRPSPRACAARASRGTRQQSVLIGFAWEAKCYMKGLSPAGTAGATTRYCEMQKNRVSASKISHKRAFHIGNARSFS